MIQSQPDKVKKDLLHLNRHHHQASYVVNTLNKEAIKLSLLYKYLVQFLVCEAKQASYDSHYICSFVFRCIKISHQHVFHKRSYRKAN